MYKIVYDFYDQNKGQYGLGACVVKAEDVQEAEIKFHLLCKNHEDIISVEFYDECVFIETFGGFKNES